MSSDKKKPVVQLVPPRVRKASDVKSDASQENFEEPAVVQPEPVEESVPVAAEPEKKQQPAAVAKPAARAEKPGVKFGDMSATMEDFEAMLNADESHVPKRRRFEVGDQVEGTVMSVGRHIFVDLGDRYEGVASPEGYLDEEGNLTLAVGDTQKFYVLSLRGGIQLGKEMEGGQGVEAVEVAFESGLPMKGRVVATNKGGYEIDLGGVPAFCPISQIDLAFTEDPNVHVGETYTFKVTDVREGGRTVVVSRAQLMREERDAARSETLAKLEPGVRVSGTVTRVADFGAFVDLGGIEGLVHISQLSHGTVDKASDVVKEGDVVEVEVLNIEPAVGDRQMRIGLSMKAAQEDPWLTVNERFTIGQKVTGTVVRLAPFGAFVELAPGLDGLVHVSQMSWERHVAVPGDVVSMGQKVQVEIQDIDVLRQRISLSMKDVEADPWTTVLERFAPGSEVTGVVENIEEFGVFVGLGGGISALLPRSEMVLPRDATPHRMFTVGKPVTAHVLSVDVERRRMALTQRSEAERAASAPAAAAGAEKQPAVEREPTSYSDAPSGRTGLGTFGDLLKNRK